MGIDAAIVQALNGWIGKSALFDALVVFVTNDLGIILIALACWYCWTRRRGDQNAGRNFLFLLSSVIVSRLLFTEIIRFFWYRPRPFLVMPVHLIVSQVATASFPSGHASTYCALAFGMYLLDKKWGTWYILCATLIALSRVILGVHYMSDVIAGALVAYASVMLMRKLFSYRIA